MSITNNGGELFEFYRGDDHPQQIEFKQDDDVTPIDITDWIISSTLKLQTTDTDAEAAIAIDLGAQSGADATNGVVTINFTNAQTSVLEPALYYFDVQAEANGVVQTVLAGKVRVLADVTQRNNQ